MAQKGTFKEYEIFDHKNPASVLKLLMTFGDRGN